MKKAILTYLVGKEIVAFVVMAAMMVGLLLACLVAYAFTPGTDADSDESYSYSYSVENHPLNGFTPNSECDLIVTES